MSKALESFERRLQQELGSVVVGLQPVVRALAIAIVARGHVLLQGAPGLGKTLLSKAFAASLGGTFKRVQGTSDLMPADITGVHVFDAERKDFTFRHGPVFADVLLVDEVNRAGPKTQSALLEAMEERQVTVDRHNYSLPPNFLVVATQNPREFEGTYPLPESQLDRFMLRVDLGYPQRDDELAILARYGNVDAHASGTSQQPIGAEAIEAARAEVESIHVAPELSGYVVDIAAASRSHAHVSLGLSTRGVLALLRAARIAAGMRGADFVTPDDVKQVAPLVIPHRLMLASDAVLEGVTEQVITQRLLDQTPVPR
ncbi:MAG TPA: MoxR family ATPase [Povalibacter sp.]|uniref:AAA family ATPase n=1 Tax=Povalibacter sp. TaxID=1962978 RepID=UPI002C21050D|nr:MoxR family ATPase [Povalibacter sp.]HMN46416.1 MoxR family ATPase [Povalibacter sp.]